MNTPSTILVAVLAAALSTVAPSAGMAQGHAGHGAPVRDSAKTAPQPPPGPSPAQEAHGGHTTSTPAAGIADHQGHGASAQPPAAPAPTAPAADHQGHGAAPAPAPAVHSGHANAPEPVPAPAPADAHIGHLSAPAPVAIALPPDTLQQAGVRTVAVTRQPLVKTIRAAGRVEIDERRIVAVTTKVEGWIEALTADYTGRPVRRGEVLARIYSPQIMATQLEYLRLKSWQKDARPAGPGDPGGDTARMLAADVNDLLAAAAQRLRLLDAGPAFVDQLEREGHVQRTIPVVSPIDGFVTAKMALAGARVMAGEKLMEIADLSRVWVIADVFEYELPLVRAGQKAHLHLGSTVLHGAAVDYIYPEINNRTRTAKVRFAVPNPGARLLPQMYATVDIDVNLGERLSVPTDAVIDTGERRIVYVATGPGRFAMTPVTIGTTAGDRVEIREGLEEGQQVAVAAVFLIDAETRLKGGAAGTGHQH